MDLSQTCGIRKPAVFNVNVWMFVEVDDVGEIICKLLTGSFFPRRSNGCKTVQIYRGIFNPTESAYLVRITYTLSGKG